MLPLSRPLGRTDVVVVLLTSERHVAGKFHAVYTEPRSGLGGNAGGYRLTGTMDLNLAGYTHTGPIDTLRALADDLTHDPANNAIRQAHEWIAIESSACCNSGPDHTTRALPAPPHRNT